MPYISTERVKEIRNELKSKFPNCKFSVRNENHSTVCVDILSANVNLLEEGKNYESVNVYWIESTHAANPEKKDFLVSIYAIINKGNGVLTEDGDYGTVPNFYTSISIGSYDKPYIFIESAIKAASVIPEIKNESKIKIIQYSDKSIAVIGDTKPIKDKLKELGGFFNFRLTCGAGWIFPMSKLESLKTSLSN